MHLAVYLFTFGFNLHCLQYATPQLFGLYLFCLIWYIVFIAPVICNGWTVACWYVLKDNCKDILFSYGQLCEVLLEEDFITAEKFAVDFLPELLKYQLDSIVNVKVTLSRTLTRAVMVTGRQHFRFNTLVFMLSLVK